MDMQPLHAGNLRAAGYDRRERILQVQLSDGRVLQYTQVSEETWRRFMAASSPWSYYRDNIEEEFACRAASAKAPASRNPLDELFGK